MGIAREQAERQRGPAIRRSARGSRPFEASERSRRHQSERDAAETPGRRHFEALVECDGALGKALAKLGEGAVEVSAPFGDGFPTFDYRRHDLYLAGHGLGLGPVRAAVLHALTERGAFEKLRVLEGADWKDREGALLVKPLIDLDVRANNGWETEPWTEVHCLARSEDGTRLYYVVTYTAVNHGWVVDLKDGRVLKTHFGEAVKLEPKEPK